MRVVQCVERRTRLAEIVLFNYQCEDLLSLRGNACAVLRNENNCKTNDAYNIQRPRDTIIQLK